MPAFHERLKSSIEVLNGEYVVLPEYKSSDAMIAEVCHVRRNDAQRVYTPVAHLSASAHSGESEGFLNPHWSVHLFVSSSVRYLADLKSTEVVSNPQRQAGPDKPFLKHLLAVRDSTLPYLHPELPHALGLALINSAVCSKPLVVHVHVSDEQAFVDFGRVAEDD